MEDIELKYGKIVLFIGIILILVVPGFLTLSLGLVEFDESTGSIGDTIGGITAPISSLMGSVLVYFALREQVKANKIITDQFKEQKQDEVYRQKMEFIQDQISLVREDLESFNIRVKSENFSGIEAIFKSLEVYINGTLDPLKLHCISQLENILDRILYIIEDIDSLGKEEDSNYLESLIYFTYDSKLFYPLNYYKKFRESNNIKGGYSLPEFLYNKFDSINAEFKIVSEEESDSS